ncbi:MAG: hypothetical protein IPP40_07185 [bacterium]|nr:hypothetical protein [bacterium]
MKFTIAVPFVVYCITLSIIMDAANAYGAPNADDAYEFIVSALVADSSRIENFELALSSGFDEICNLGATVHQDDIDSLLWATILNQDASPSYRSNALWGLRLYWSSEVESLATSMLNDPDVASSAALTLASQQLWTTCIGHLVGAEQYEVLAKYEHPSLDSILEVAINSASPYGRVKAAYYLEEQGEIGILSEVSTDVLYLLLTIGDTSAEASNRNRALLLSLTSIEDNSNVVLPYIEQGLESQYQSYRLFSFDVLSNLVSEGDIAAVSLMEDFSLTTNDSELKQYALFYLMRAGNPSAPNFPARR